MPNRFRTRTVEVEAIRWTGDNIDELEKWTVGKFQELHPDDRAACEDPEATAEVYDKLHSTWILVLPGQWIVKGVKNEFYPCDNETFHWKYEDASQPENLRCDFDCDGCHPDEDFKPLGGLVAPFEAVG